MVSRFQGIEHGFSANLRGENGVPDIANGLRQMRVRVAKRNDPLPPRQMMIPKLDGFCIGDIEGIEKVVGAVDNLNGKLVPQQIEGVHLLFGVPRYREPTRGVRDDGVSPEFRDPLVVANQIHFHRVLLANIEDEKMVVLGSRFLSPPHVAVTLTLYFLPNGVVVGNEHEVQTSAVHPVFAVGDCANAVAVRGVDMAVSTLALK